MGFVYFLIAAEPVGSRRSQKTIWLSLPAEQNILGSEGFICTHLSVEECEPEKTRVFNMVVVSHIEIVRSPEAAN